MPDYLKKFIDMAMTHREKPGNDIFSPHGQGEVNQRRVH
jgi:hypothetical protein